MSNAPSPDRSIGSDLSAGFVHSAPAKPLRPSGGNHDPRASHGGTIVYDATVAFCGRFLDRRSQAVSEMQEAARSARQTIAEATRATAESPQSRLQLLNLARARLDDLLLDYEDFLRERGLPRWDKNDPEALAVRAMAREAREAEGGRLEARAYARWLAHEDPAMVANAILCLIHQTNYLLDRQIRGLEREFDAAVGRSEQAPSARTESPQKQNQAERSERSNHTDGGARPTCPACGRPMVVRTARQGARTGSRFWGCLGYPDCKNTLPFRASDSPMPAAPSDGSGESV